MARQGWFSGLFTGMAFHNPDEYPGSPYHYLPSVMAREAEEKRRYNETWTAEQVFDELGEVR